MQHIMACRCGHEENVDRDQTRLGASWRCPTCGEYVARVLSRDGRAEWCVLDPGYADFLRLADEPEPDEDEGYWEFAPPAPADQVGPDYWETVGDAVIREEAERKPS